MDSSLALLGSRSDEFVVLQQISDLVRKCKEVLQYCGGSDREPLIDTTCYETRVNNLSSGKSSIIEAIAGLSFPRFTWVDTLYALPSSVAYQFGFSANFT
jgi:hypothetical protein